MFNGDPSMPPVTYVLTEQIQKYLEENQQLILAIMECRKWGKFSDMCKYQNKLQYNLSYLAKVADAQPQAQMESQLLSQFVSQREQGIQYPHKALSQQQLDLSSSNMPFQMNDHCQQQHYGAFSLQCNTSTTDQQHQQPDVSTPKFQMDNQQQPDAPPSTLPLVMNDQQQQLLVAFSQQLSDVSASKLPFQMTDPQPHPQQHHVVTSVQQPDLSTSRLNDKQQRQHYPVISLKQTGLYNSELPFELNDWKHKQPALFQQQRLIQGPMNSLPGTNGGVYQASQSRLSINLSDTQENNQFNTDACPWVSGKVNFWTGQ